MAVGREGGHSISLVVADLKMYFLFKGGIPPQSLNCKTEYITLSMAFVDSLVMMALYLRECALIG